MEEVEEMLKKHRLESFLEDFKALGVETVQDIQDVETNDLMTMGMITNFQL